MVLPGNPWKITRFSTKSLKNRFDSSRSPGKSVWFPTKSLKNCFDFPWNPRKSTRNSWKKRRISAFPLLFFLVVQRSALELSRQSHALEVQLIIPSSARKQITKFIYSIVMKSRHGSTSSWSLAMTCILPSITMVIDGRRLGYWLKTLTKNCNQLWIQRRRLYWKLSTKQKWNNSSFLLNDLQSSRSFGIENFFFLEFKCKWN